MTYRLAMAIGGAALGAAMGYGLSAWARKKKKSQGKDPAT